MKTVLDSVHGTITIPKVLFENVIDTKEFQRLRRIEQNSCRSVYPSARHDRFIHSLGVYHLGSRIADSIIEKDRSKKEHILPDNADVVLDTYKLACLLHDVGHTPFSHTFEEFFDYDTMLGKLKDIFKDEKFSEDASNSKKRAAQHEVLSALVGVETYSKIFEEQKIDMKIDWVLFARMITGFRYLDENKEPIGSFENAMIELIHGDIIDADGLDYVCRDVWAGGYRTFNIDLNRLISSINIFKDEQGKYSVVYTSKALNEIETVLNVKNFQYLYVIKHHKVLLEQYYLVEAMKSAACSHLGEALDKEPNDRDNALRTICDYTIYFQPRKFEKSSYNLYSPTDDDFVAMMKLTPETDSYIEGWFSRSFKHQPLWKSKLEYFNIFRRITNYLKEDSKFNICDLLCSDDFKHYIVQKINGFTINDIIVVKVEPKIRRLDPDKITVLLNGEHIPYSALNHDMFSVIGSYQSFCYIYLNFNKLPEGDKREQRKAILLMIEDYLMSKLREIVSMRN